ncbi:unnamed protein product [Xylocopa violacea]|uniref:CCHC-type domain-containing protein n=1 Tax=Xylocopa violacea TaxID=135666 RepID=A0ABP1MVT6_XYLVO
MNSELKSLIAERGTIKAALTRLQTFFRENASTTKVGALQKRLAANTSHYQRFNSIQTRIEMLVAGSELEEAHALDRENFETTYFDLIDEIETFIEASKSSQHRNMSSPSACSAASGTANGLKLPTIQLPSFDGNCSDWLKFRDSFVSLVHDNDVLSDVQRFHYLNSSLRGPAARIIQSLGVSEANYKLAWELLNSRYKNSTTLKRHHANALLDLKPIQRQSETTLREFLDDATNHRLALTTLGESVDKADFLIIPLLSRKLDSVTFREWERRISPHSEMPTYEQFSVFLEERARYLSNIAVNGQVTVPKVDQRPGNSGSRKYNVTAHVINSKTCPVCDAKHALFQCEKFKTLEALQKTKVVQDAQICFNCLEPGHRVKACTRTRCKICDKKHHSLLHRPDIHPSRPMNSCVSSKEESPPCVAHASNNLVDCTILPTAIVHVRGNNGEALE